MVESERQSVREEVWGEERQGEAEGNERRKGEVERGDRKGLELDR